VEIEPEKRVDLAGLIKGLMELLSPISQAIKNALQNLNDSDKTSFDKIQCAISVLDYLEKVAEDQKAEIEKKLKQSVLDGILIPIQGDVKRIRKMACQELNKQLSKGTRISFPNIC